MSDTEKKESVVLGWVVMAVGKYAGCNPKEHIFLTPEQEYSDYKLDAALHNSEENAQFWADCFNKSPHTVRQAAHDHIVVSVSMDSL